MPGLTNDMLGNLWNIHLFWALSNTIVPDSLAQKWSSLVWFDQFARPDDGD